MRFEFAGCALDAATYTLVRDGQPITVEPQVFDLLHTLASQAGNVVTKDDLIEAVWAGRIVSDATISARVSAARAAVGD
ncbi:MAG: winged helix-turn-helix domain-containing protein, partial [Paracoccaceae bacterium]|nr:winged helix-turn-helix domain-containing protein [Paracoccaceae bacterium]